MSCRYVPWQAPPSFADYVRARQPALVRFARVLCGDSHLADDLVQDALVGTALRWGRIERRDDPDVYVRRAIVNGFLNRRRQQRAVLVLRYYEDLSEAEIAEVLGCSAGTVKSTTSRAMAKLRAALAGTRASIGEGENR